MNKCSIRNQKFKKFTFKFGNFPKPFYAKEFFRKFVMKPYQQIPELPEIRKQ